MGYGGGNGGYVPPAQTYGPTQPARQYAPSADPTGRYYRDDPNGEWLWENFAPADPVGGIYQPPQSVYNPPFPSGGIWEYAQNNQPPQSDLIDNRPYPAIDQTGVGFAPYGDPQYYEDGSYNNPYTGAPSNWIDYGQVQPGDADQGLGGFPYTDPRYGDADMGVGGSVANMPGYGSQPELDQWRNNSEGLQLLPYESPQDQVLREILGQERRGGGFFEETGLGKAFNAASFPSDYISELGIDMFNPGGIQGVASGGRRSAGPLAQDLEDPRQTVEDYRDRPLWQQAAVGSVVDPLNYLGGLGFAADVVDFGNLARKGGGALVDATRPVMRGLGEYGTDVASGLGRAAPSPYSFEDIVRPVREEIPIPAIGGAAEEAPEVTAAKRALIDALDKEANIRKVGTAAREIHEGRVAQAGGIRGQLDEGLAEGLSGQELVDKARGGAAVGTLRKTVADAPELTPEVKTTLYNDLVRQQIDGDITEFEFLQGGVVLGKVLNGDMNLQPKQAALLRRILGDEVVDRIIATRRADPDALTRAQEARLAAQNTAREETLLARAEKAAAQAEARATRATNTAQETLDRAAFRDKWQAISKRNDADEIRTLLADRFMTPEERSIAIKAVTRETEKAQRAAGAATDAVWAKAAKADPEAETLRRNAQEVLAKQVSDPRRREQMERTIALWTDQNRVRLDSIKSSMPDIVNAVTGSIRAAATGQLKDSWLTAAAYRKADLVNALEAQGLETEFAKKVANAMFERELKLKYPKGVPEDIAKQVQMTKSLPYGESEGFSKLGGISQDMKNSAFGIDFGIMGQQVLHAFRYGGPNIMAGAVNELLSALHLPSVRLFGDDLPREVEMLLDGVNVGAPTGISDFSRQSSMLSWLGKPGKAIDQKVYLPLADKLTDLQFRTVLGRVRRWNYEGNLLISKLAGSDITNAKVRATAGDYANANTSYGRLAVDTTRREAERGLLLTPSMRRAQINQILQVGKLLAPTASPQQRILAAATIASWGASTLVIGKLLHDYAGVGDFEWDPSKPGYGNITLKNGYVINLYPQEQILKTLARSARILTDLEDADWTQLREEWGKLAMGSSSPPLQGAEKAAGFGYQPGEGYKFGDYGEGMSPVQRILASLPLPTMASNYMQGDAFTTAAGAGGFPAYKESDYVEFNRDITEWAKKNNVRDDQGKLITSWGDLDKGQKQAAEAAGLKPPEYDGPSDPVTDARFADYGRVRDGAIDDLRKRIDAGATGRDLRTAIGEFKDTVRVAGNTALDQVKDAKPDSKRDLYGGLYWSVDAPTKADGTTDFDALDAERARILAEAQSAGVDPAYITGKGEGTYRGLRYTDPVVREAVFKLEDDRELIEESGLWELKPTTWKQLQSLAPADLGQYATFDDFQEAYVQLLIPEYTKAGMSPAVARTQAENKVGGFPVTKRYYDLVNAQELDWMLKNPEAATAAVEWGYWEPTKKQAGASIGVIR